jgi:hypothetical protein
MQTSYWLDVKYANLMSSRLTLFKNKKNSPYLANFRCPFCGDSQSNKLKARGYIYEKDSKLKMVCHNCGHSTYLFKFIQEVDPSLAAEYRLESLQELGLSRQNQKEHVPDISKITKPRFANFKPLKSLKKISQLSPAHPAARYVREERKIPSHYHFKLFYCSKFFKWVNELIPGKFEDYQLKHDEPRLVIPFMDENGYCFGFQGRSFDKNSQMRYITIMLDETKPKLYGLDTVDFTKEFYTLEGPIDSMFVPNSIAMAGSDAAILSTLPRDKNVLVFDNQPRNGAVVKKISAAIENNYRVFIWPKGIKGKDINDLTKDGMTESEIMDMLHNNSHQGMVAKVKFLEWKKT